MICERYNELTIKEKVEFIGKLQHMVQSDDHFFAMASTLVKSAEVQGLFKDVKILPNKTNNDE